MNSTDITKFLVENEIHSSCFDFDEELKKFLEDMDMGLAKKGGGSMLMIPTYISVEKTVPLNERIIVIDAGGTNFRVAVLMFDSCKKPQIEYFENYAMPGTDSVITVEEFFDKVASYILPVADRSDKIGFCFSYAVDMMPNKDGKIVRFCKEVEIKNAVGAKVCEGVAAALARAGVTKKKKFVLINDTVATLLGGFANENSVDYSAFIGFILGTGINACYPERAERIKTFDRADYKKDNMIINTECGSYNKVKRGPSDIELDKKSSQPGTTIFEKMLSGVYLGKLMCLSAKLAAANGFFSESFSERLSAIEQFSLKDIDMYCAGKTDNAVFELCRGDSKSEDGAMLRVIIEAVYDRAAKFAICALLALALKTGEGKTPNRPICVCADGSTIHKSAILKGRINAYNDEYAKGKYGVYMDIVKVENSVLIGTAVAGLNN
ncbi:MAG: hypothetical protein RR058_01530 [Oscillospiraceae bacterium]